ncbi:MAG: pyridoxamine 5'-phosphate oxidase family protein [Trueperaceae bacterium]
MGKQYSEISDMHKAFIEKQKMYFVATAAKDGRVNVSPKGMDTFRVVGQNKIIWLNLTGSGNETAAHLLDTNRMTIMFCDFDDRPLILRLYGPATAIYPRDTAWQHYAPMFDSYVSARQIYEMNVDLVQTSCGFGVPLFAYQGDRDNLTTWANGKGEEGIKTYWTERNQKSIDGKETGIV